MISRLLICLFSLFSSLASAQSPAPRWTRSAQYGIIRDAAFSKDGRYLATIGDRDTRVFLWDLVSGSTTPRIFNSPTYYRGAEMAGRYSVTFSGDSKHVFAGGDSIIYVWALATGALEDSIIANTRGVAAIQASLNGDTLLWINDKEVCVRYAVDKRRLIDTMSIQYDLSGPPFNPPYRLACSDDLKRIVCRSPATKGILIYDLTKRKSALMPRRPTDEFIISSNSQRVAIELPGSIVVMDLQTQNVVDSISAGDARLLGFTSTGDTLIYRDSLQRTLDLTSGNVVSSSAAKFSIPLQWSRILRIGPDLSPASGHVLVTDGLLIPPAGGSTYASASIIDLATGKPVQLTGNESDINSIKWSPRADQLTVSDGAGMVQNYLGESGEILGTFTPYYYGGSVDASVMNVPTMDYSPDGTSLLAELDFRYESYLHIPDLRETRRWCYYGGDNLQSAHGGKYLLSNLIIDSSTCRVDTLHYPFIYKITASKTGLFVGDSISLYSLDITTSQAQKLPVSGYPTLLDMAVSPNGDLIALIRKDHSVEIRSFPDCALLHTIHYDSFVTSAYFSPNSKCLAISSTDSTIRIWDVASGDVIQTYAYPDVLYTAGFSYDGKYIAAAAGKSDSRHSVGYHTGVAGSTVVVWDVPDIVSTVASYANSNIELTSAFPNPANDGTTIGYTLPIQDRIDLTLFDILGRPIASLFSGEQTSGPHQIEIPKSICRGLSKGVYYYRLQTTSQVMTRSLLIE